MIKGYILVRETGKIVRSRDKKRQDYQCFRGRYFTKDDLGSLLEREIRGEAYNYEIAKTIINRIYGNNPQITTALPTLDNFRQLKKKYKNYAKSQERYLSQIIKDENQMIAVVTGKSPFIEQIEAFTSPLTPRRKIGGVDLQYDKEAIKMYLLNQCIVNI